MSLLHLIIGRPLRSDEQDDARIGVAEGVPALGLDGLSSSAYGPEAALAILLPLGVLGLHYIIPITAAILVLLALLYFSYRQTIAAYPVGGGSYTVAKENLGIQAGLLAGAALMLDYVLTVAVGISAGIAALVSAFPPLHRYTVVLCLGTLALITLLNLRGTAEAGRAFSLPTYLFLGTMGLVLTIGIMKTIAHGGRPSAAITPPKIPPAAEAAGMWILLRAFASGCTAMTGVEAVSNGVGAFKQPTVKYATRTLTVIIIALMILLGAIAFLCSSFHIGAMDQNHPGYQSVLSQLIGAIVGHGVLYYTAIVSMLLVLCLSANTSFVGFPRLCQLIAQDEYLPRAFAVLGRRLVYSAGILFLAGTAGALIFAFRGITDKLIPLYAVGAFMAFTLSQAGMVMHWLKQSGRRSNMIINAAGAIGTAVALVIILAAKFVEGAWLTVIVIPLLWFSFNLVHHYYNWYTKQIAGHEPIDVNATQTPVVVLPMRDLNRLTDKALDFAIDISDNVIGVHLSNVDGQEAKEQAEHLQHEWQQRMQGPDAQSCANLPQLRMISSPYRLFLDPLLNELQKIQKQYPDRQIAVIIPQLIKTHWWQALLHDGRAHHLQNALMKLDGMNTVVINMPLHLDPPATM